MAKPDVKGSGPLSQQKQKIESVKWLALIVVIVGTFMAMLSGTTVNVALPRMMVIFGTDYTTAKWIITGYALASGAVIPVTGYLSDVFGSKRVYIFALSMFTLGSILCGFSTTFDQMIFFRVLQAIGGGMIMPVGMGMILELFEPHERGAAMGVWGIAAMAAPMLGPTMGGAIVQYMDWKLIFFINVPVGIVGVVLAVILLRNPGKIRMKKIDILGFASSTAGLVCLLYIFGEWAAIDWSNMIYPIILVMGVGFMAMFIINELTHPDPLLDLRMFKIVSFTQAQIIGIIMTIALMGGTFVLPLFFQNIQGMTPMQSGMMMLPSAIVTSIMFGVSGVLYNRVGIRTIAVSGLTIMLIASVFLAFAINVNTPKSTLIFLTCMRALGMGLVMMPVNTYGVKEIVGKASVKAAALATTVRQIFGAFAVTLMTVLIKYYDTANYAEMAQQVTPSNPYIYGFFSKIAQLYTSMGLPAAQAQGSALQLMGGLIARTAYVSAMGQATGIMALMTIAAIALAFFLYEKKKTGGIGEKARERLTTGF